MSRKGAIETNNKRKVLVEKYRARRLELKAEIINPNNNMQKKLEYQTLLHNLPRNSSRTRVRNRCAMTGRPRGYNRFFGCSRIILRNSSREGLLPGVIQASW